MKSSFVVLIAVAFFATACNSSAETKTEEQKVETVESTEEVESDEQKQNRPSPLVKVNTEVDGVKIDMEYGSPSVKGRVIWGELVAYSEVWRIGANEATWISFDKNVTVNGSNLTAGKYSVFAIPGENEWTIIFNKVWNQWGAYKYDANEDALRLVVKPIMGNEIKERLVFEVNNGNLNFAWEKLSFSLAIKAA